MTQDKKEIGMNMYKNSDYSKNATRAAEITTCGDTGEVGLTVWFGTKSKRSGLKKANEVMKAIMDLKLKKFPEIKTRKTR